jgi:nucleoside-diphosphate-sugar epimerase
VVLALIQSTGLLFLFNNDFLWSLQHTMLPMEGCPTYDAASGEMHSVAEVIALIQKIAGTDLPVIETGEKGTPTFDDYKIKPQRIRAALRWMPEYSLEEGLRATMLPVGA